MQSLSLLTASPPIVSGTGLLIIRLGVGAVFIAHGYGDVFGSGIAANVENYRDAGIPLPAIAAPFAAFAQLLGGALIIAGALTRVCAAALAVVMAGALFFVHWGEPLVLGQDGSGSGFAFIMGVAATALILTGPGQFSVEALLAVRGASAQALPRTEVIPNDVAP